MDGPSATRLRDVVIAHDQSGARWRAGHASIRAGRIVVMPGEPAPRGFFIATGTYTIEAFDGGNRARRFAQLVLSALNSKPPKEYVFD